MNTGANQIRVAVFPPQYTKDQATGKIHGWPVDIAHALGARLGAKVVLAEYPGPHKVLEDFKADGCDVAFLPIEPSWAAEVECSQPFLQIDFTYLVAPNSSIRSVSDADRIGVRIAAVQKHASTLVVSRLLKNATLIESETPDTTFELLRSGRADAMASLRPVLLRYSAELPGSAVLEDRYGANFLTVAIPKRHAERAASMREFVEQAKASGLVQRAIDRAGWRGAQVPPPESQR